MKTFSTLESTEQTRDLFLRCSGEKRGISRVDCICFSFILISTTDYPHFPLELFDFKFPAFIGQRQIVRLCLVGML